MSAGAGTTGGAEPDSSPSVYEWQWGWGVAVAVNLPVPLVFGFGAVAKGGALGMLAGIVAFWLVGCAVIARLPCARRLLVYSGGILSLSQVFPVAQVFAGAAALNLCGIRSESLPANSDSFLVTLVTGGLLLSVALTGGLFVRAVGWLFRGSAQQNPS